jgi:hypothetical protein
LTGLKTVALTGRGHSKYNPFVKSGNVYKVTHTLGIGTGLMDGTGPYKTWRIRLRHIDNTNTTWFDFNMKSSFGWYSYANNNKVWRTFEYSSSGGWFYGAFKYGEKIIPDIKMSI